MGQFTRYVRIDEPGCNAVYRDVAAADFLRQGLAEPDHARLCCSIVDLAGVTHGSDNRRNVDDAPESRFHHRSNDRFAQAEDRFQIGTHDLVPFGIFHAQQQVVPCDACIVHENGHRAMIGFDPRENGLCFCGIDHIELVSRPLQALASKVFRNSGCPGVTGSSSCNRCPGFAQSDCNGSTYSPAGSSHQYDFLLEHGPSHYFSAAKAVLNAGSSAKENDCVCGAIRLHRPASTLPGPHSTMWVTPDVTNARMVSTQRTG